MRKLLILAVAIAAAACAVNRNGNPYEEPPFYAQFLNTGSTLDARIQQTLAALQADPESSVLHNELGALLMRKGFPKDAEREFERAINNDGGFYPAWYNLGLVRAANGNHSGARRAFHRTVRLRKGHGPALFQLGLMAEDAGDHQSAITYYAKAFRHNRELLDVKHNPRLLDSKLIHLALLSNYQRQHAADSADFRQAPADYVQPRDDREAASPESAPANIVTPTAPATDPGTQTPPPPVTNT